MISGQHRFSGTNTEERENAVPILSLTDLALRRLKPTSAQVSYWDKGLPNFGIRVSPGGAMTWTLLLGSNRQRVSIGRYPTIGLAQARIEAKRMLAEHTLGRRTPQTLSFQDALATYVATHLVNNRTGYESERVLTKHFLPVLKSKKLTDIHFQHLSHVIDRIKTAPAANHVYFEARTFFNWAVKRHYISASPLAGSTQPHHTVTRDRVLTHDELKRVWQAAIQIGYPYGSIVQLLILTGQRRGETSALRRSFIQNSEISFPSEIVKNKRRHVFPLGPMALQVLDSIPNTGDRLFPARGTEDETYSGWSTAFKQLQRHSGVSEFTLHDLRRTFATNLASLRVPIHVIERLLNHTGGAISGVAAIYNRFSYAREMRDAIELWEQHFSAILVDKASRAA
jgi:integrase